MNILPKKSWHVRSKKNIAKVRKDEAEAAEREKLKQQKILFAEKEARLNLLREKANLKNAVSNHQETDVEAPSNSKKLEHINFFDEKQLTNSTETNLENEKEKKNEKEKYEKQIGYLTYLGQDTNEILKTKSWYESVPERPDPDDITEINLEKKQKYDPLNLINKLLDKKPEKKYEKVKTIKKKHKKRDKELDKKMKLETLRKERLLREAEEKKKTELFLASLKKEPIVTNQKYNSQFNPHLAKQHFVKK